jgi:ribonuclease HI
LVLSGLEGAKSRVRTNGGLTDWFDLGSSVRQGDPLSPLVFAMVTDSLHSGFTDNPIFPKESTDKWGYTFHNSPRGRVRICSSGYADDSCLVAENATALAQMHAWVRIWYGANFFSFNATKTKLLCSNVKLAPPIPSVDGSSFVAALPAGTTIRYLGLYINLDLDWHEQTARMDSMVWATCESIRSHEFDVDISAAVVRQFLLPCLKIGLESANLPQATVKGWDARIRFACLAAATIRMGPSLNVAAFYLGIAVPRLEDHRWAIRGEELLIRLNASYPSSASAWARLNGTIHSGNNPGRCRATATTEAILSRYNIRIGQRLSVVPADPVPLFPLPGYAQATRSDSLLADDWLPHRRPALTFVEADLQDPGSVDIFTDGSTGKDASLPTGCAVVKALRGGRTVSRGFACPRGGDNFAAELAALVAAIQSVPASVNLTIHTDSQACIGAVNNGRLRNWAEGGFLNIYALSSRRRVAAAARPLMNCARKLIEGRSGAVSIVHVKAHSGARDWRSKLNDVADDVANAARIAAAKLPLPSDELRDLAGEVEVGMWLPNKRGPGQGAAVIGSFRKAVLRRAEQVLLTQLQHPKLARQGLIARACGDHMVTALKVARKQNDAPLTVFMTLATASWLPVERRLFIARTDARRGESCKLCGKDRDTVFHALCSCTTSQVAASRGCSVRDAAAMFGPCDGDSGFLPAFFDPTIPASPISVPSALDDKVVLGLNDFPPLARFIGILPEGVEDLIARKGDDLKSIQKKTTALSCSLMWGALRTWSARMRSMNSLLSSQPGMASDYARLMAERARSRRRKKALNYTESLAIKFARRKAAGVAKKSFDLSVLPRRNRSCPCGTGKAFRYCCEPKFMRSADVPPALAVSPEAICPRIQRSALAKCRSAKYADMVASTPVEEDMAELVTEFQRDLRKVYGLVFDTF